MLATTAPTTLIHIDQIQLLLSRTIFWHAVYTLFVSIVLAIFTLDALLEQAAQQFLTKLAHRWSCVRVHDEGVRYFVVFTATTAANR